MSLHAIVDVDSAARSGWDPADLARAYLAGGAPWVQVRAKHLESRPFLTLCDVVVRLAEPYRARVIVNDRVDLAVLAGAAGVHVGQDDLPPSAARTILGASAEVGLSTHTPEQIDAAAGEPITYLAIGPVFGTSTKATGYDAVGLERVTRAVAGARGRPVVAIGGITLDLAPSVMSAGATAVAVITDLLATGDPEARVRQYLDRLGVVQPL